MSEQNENVSNDMIGDDHDVVEEVNINNNDDVDMEEEEEEEEDDDDDYEDDEACWEDDDAWDPEHPLLRAIRRNEAEDVILQLIDLYPDVLEEIDDSRGEYLLHKAFRHVHSDNVLRKLIETFPEAIRHQNYRGEYPLHIACNYYESESNMIILALILIFPFTVKKPNNQGRYPFHIACLNNQPDHIVEELFKVFPEVAYIKLIKRKIRDSQFCSNHGYALHLAVNGRQVDEEVIRELIKVNPNAIFERDCDGNYPINYAIDTNRSTELIGLMIDIDPLAIYREDQYGITPFHNVCCKKNYNTRIIEYKYNMMAYMIHNYSDISINYKTSTGGYTPLHYACGTGGRYYNASHLERLLQYPDIDVNIRDNNNETPLHKAVLFQQDIHALEQLFNHPSIIINLKNNDNETPLDLLHERKSNFLKRTDVDESTTILKLQLFNNIEKLFEEPATKQRWIAYCFILNIP